MYTKPVSRALGSKLEFGMYGVGFHAHFGFRVQGSESEVEVLSRAISYDFTCVSEPSFESALCECPL